MMLQYLSSFLQCFAEALDSDERQISKSHAKRLRILHAGLSATQNVPSGRVPVQAICEAELEAYAQHSPLAKALSDIMPFVHVTRSDKYLSAPPSPDFGDNYGYGVICGPDGGSAPALIRDSEIAFGLMLLGPKTHYPLHHHPADEVYYTVTGPSFWRTEQEGWLPRDAEEVIHHPSWITHATLSGNRPLVLLYVWQGDLLTDAVFVSDFMMSDANLATKGVGSL